VQSCRCFTWKEHHSPGYKTREYLYNKR
jgi:hypothetical protein